MTIFHLKFVTISSVLLFILVSLSVGFEENSADISQSSNEERDFEILRERSNTFLRNLIMDNDLSTQDDNSFNHVQTFQRRDQMNTTHYKDRKGRICVLCKWGIVPCCEPHTCQKHRIRFNECVENNTQ
ncbi:hypothetical protein I4U23_006843 [Adineta vaga]|nr:hypothetical protein I4U23_006843 [Adineta vaga]